MVENVHTPSNGVSTGSVHPSPNPALCIDNVFHFPTKAGGNVITGNFSDYGLTLEPDYLDSTPYSIISPTL